MHINNSISVGKSLSETDKALILLHGRGGSATDILSIADLLQVSEYAIIAPQATNNTWYPYTFLSPPRQNEPWLSSALLLIAGIVKNLNDQGVKSDNIFISGFSQGACLALEYATRYAKQYGGIIAFSGGLIGDRIYYDSYKGDFNNTPVFIGSGDPDPHIPVQRVTATAELLKKMKARVNMQIYPHMGHTISREEIDLVNEFIFYNCV